MRMLFKRNHCLPPALRLLLCPPLLRIRHHQKTPLAESWVAIVRETEAVLKEGTTTTVTKPVMSVRASRLLGTEPAPTLQWVFNPAQV